MGRWQHTFYLLRPLAIKLITPRSLALIGILAYGLAVAFDPRPDSISGDKPIRETLSLDHQIVLYDELPTETTDIYINWNKLTVNTGDNLSTLFYRAGLNDLDVYRISNAKEGKSLRNLFPGEVLRV